MCGRLGLGFIPPKVSQIHASYTWYVSGALNVRFGAKIRKFSSLMMFQYFRLYLFCCKMFYGKHFLARVCFLVKCWLNCKCFQLTEKHSVTIWKMVYAQIFLKPFSKISHTHLSRTNSPPPPPPPSSKLSRINPPSRLSRTTHTPPTPPPPKALVISPSKRSRWR
jgi:hypothetical protein